MNRRHLSPRVELFESRRLLSAVTVAPIRVTETNATQIAMLTATLDVPAAAPITLNYATANKTAIAGVDFRSTKGAVVIPAGQTSAKFSIPILGDTKAEPTKTFLINLVAKGATLRSRNVVVTIIDDDPTPAVSLPDLVVAEGTKRPTSVSVPITLSIASASPVKITYTTVPGTALAKSDFTAAKGSITLKPGQKSATIKLAIQRDAISEPDEAFNLKILSATNASIASLNSAGLFSRIVIADDDTPSLPRPVLSIANTLAIEGAPASFTFSLSAANTRDVSLRYRTVAGTAATSRFISADAILTIPAGQTTASVSIPTTSDTLTQGDQQFSLLVTGVANASVPSTSATATILDDESFPSASVAAVSTPEGAAGATTPVTVTVTLSAPAPVPTSVNYATADGSAIAGQDYQSASGTLTFAAGQTSAHFTVNILGNNTYSLDKSLSIQLSSPVHLSATTNGTLTIVNDDPLPTISIASASTPEGNSGTANLAFSVLLSGASELPITVHFATSGGTATAGTDFVTTAGDLTFAPGQTLKTILIPINGDTTVEPDETFTVTLSSPTNATLQSAVATGTITNDDAATLSIASASIAEGDSGTSNLLFNVTLSAMSDSVVTVAYSTSNGTASSGSDYTALSDVLIFAPGQTTKQIAIPIIGDTTVEPDETFTVTLLSPTNATLATPSATGTILNDDVPPPIAITNGSILEGNAGTSSLFLTVMLGTPAVTDTTVSCMYVDGSATTGSDYSGPNSVIIPTGQTSAVLQISIVGDTTFETDETFTVTVSLNGNQATGTGTILNDD